LGPTVAAHAPELWQSTAQSLTQLLEQSCELLQASEQLLMHV